MSKKLNIPFLFCLLLLSTIIFFWLISSLFYPDVFKGSFQQLDPDSLLFTRLLEQSLLKGRVTEYDNYAAFPYQVHTGFAPLYIKFLFAFVSFIYYLFPPVSFDPIYIASILPILIPWLLSLILVFSIYKLTDDKVLTLFSAFGMLPGFFNSMLSGFGKLDYDFLISSYIWFWLLFSAFYIKTQNHIFAYLGGIVTALFVSTWTGAPFFYFFATLYAAVLWFINYKDNSSYIAYAFVTMFIGGVIALLFLPRTEESYRYFLEVNVGRYSYFQGILVLVGAVFIYFLKFIERFSKPRILGLGLICVSIVTLLFTFHELLFQATGILFKTDPIHATISELVSGLNISNIFKGEINIIFYRFTPIVLFFPLVFLYKNNRKEIEFIKHWLMIFSVLFVYQVRYARWMGCGYGLIIGFLLYYLWNIIKNAIAKHSSSLWKTSICLLPIMIVVISINYSVISSGNKLSSTRVELYNWIIENTPVTSGYADENQPEYGILAYWDEGNRLSYYTKRPVAVSNSMWGYKTMADIFSSENEAIAFNLCKEKKIKYILVEPGRLVDNLALSYWPLLKNMPETGEYKLYYGDVPIKNEFNYFYFWLSNNLGLTKLGDFSCSEHFRVIFANKSLNDVISKYILFQTVEGALFKVETEPNTIISLSLEFKADKLPFIYKVEKDADEKGVCEFRLPYSNDYSRGNVFTDPYYKISIEKEGKKQLAKLVVPEEAVINGETLNLEKQLTYLSD